MSKLVSNPAPDKVRVGTDSIGRPIWKRIEDPKQKLMARVVPGGGGCMLWTGAKNDGGYGQICVNGVRYYTHRLAYELQNGPIPEGLHLDHLCRVHACCNPEHLEAVAPGENTRRGEPAQRTHCPAGHPYTPANTRIRQRLDAKSKTLVASRECRQCGRLRNRAKYAARTHCDEGHPYSPENTLICSDGKRWCKTCREAFYARRRKSARPDEHRP